MNELLLAISLMCSKNYVCIEKVISQINKVEQITNEHTRSGKNSIYYNGASVDFDDFERIENSDFYRLKN